MHLLLSVLFLNSVYLTLFDYLFTQLCFHKIFSFLASRTLLLLIFIPHRILQCPEQSRFQINVVGLMNGQINEAINTDGESEKDVLNVADRVYKEVGVTGKDRAFERSPKFSNKSKVSVM